MSLQKIVRCDFHHDKSMVLYELIDAETGEHYLVDQVGDGTY